MAINCPNCGSAIKDNGKFCSYCGVKLPDDTKRVEIKIDNTAEIRRAEYEEKESQLRQKKMERELRKEQRKPYIIAAKVLSVLVPVAIAFFGWVPPAFIFVGGAFLLIWALQYMKSI